MVDMEASGGEEPGLVSVQGRQGNVSFRPYRDIRTKDLTSPGVEEEEMETEDEEAVSVRLDMSEVLNPDTLCHLFAFLDTKSKGRAAQVNTLIVSIFDDNLQSRYLIWTAQLSFPWPPASYQLGFTVEMFYLQNERIFSIFVREPSIRLICQARLSSTLDHTSPFSFLGPNLCTANAFLNQIFIFNMKGRSSMLL